MTTDASERFQHQRVGVVAVHLEGRFFRLGAMFLIKRLIIEISPPPTRIFVKIGPVVKVP